MALASAAIAVAVALPRIAQPLSYHNFADNRGLAGIPNFQNVVSNAPFLILGVWGLIITFRSRNAFRTTAERWPFATFFVGVALTSVGSSYYHLHPDNARLVWDRLPMTLGFMGLLAAVLGERVSSKAATALLPFLVLSGAASVFYWQVTEAHGTGDLRPYLVVQFGSLILILGTLLLFRSAYTNGRWFVTALGLYCVAKFLEAYDSAIFRVLQIVSGHALKHLAAAAAALCIVQMLRSRAALAAPVKLPVSRTRLISQHQSTAQFTPTF